MREQANKVLSERYDLKPGEAMDPATGELVNADQAAAAGIVTGRAAPATPAEESDDEFFYNPELAEVDPVRQVTIPVLKWNAGVSLVVQITIPIKKGKDLKAQGKSKFEAPNVTIVKAVKGQLRTLILGTILDQELREAYPNDAYVGRWFAMKKLPKRIFVDPTDGATKERAYYEYQIIEISDPSANLITREGRKQITQEPVDAVAGK